MGAHCFVHVRATKGTIQRVRSRDSETAMFKFVPRPCRLPLARIFITQWSGNLLSVAFFARARKRRLNLSEVSVARYVVCDETQSRQPFDDVHDAEEQLFLISRKLPVMGGRISKDVDVERESAETNKTHTTRTDQIRVPSRDSRRLTYCA